MKLTNKYNYPETVVQAVHHQLGHRPQLQTIRVTELIRSPVIKYLLMKYWDEVEVDVDEVLVRLFGTAWHSYILHSYRLGQWTEHRWAVDYNKYTIVGHTDIYNAETGLLEDYKVQSAWAFVFEQPSWEKQLNVYAWLIRSAGYQVNKLRIRAFLRDWSKWESQKTHSKEYPDRQFYTVDVPLWTFSQQDKYIAERVSLYDRVFTTHDDKILASICTPADRWRTPDKWAVKKKTRQDAVGGRLCNSYDEAQNFIDSRKDKNKWEIQFRRGQDKYCNEWCVVRRVCPYRAGYNGKSNNVS